MPRSRKSGGLRPNVAGAKTSPQVTQLPPTNGIKLACGLDDVNPCRPESSTRPHQTPALRTMRTGSLGSERIANMGSYRSCSAGTAN
jgi:hypothetical protein